MSIAMPSTPPPVETPRPVLWNVTEFHRMKAGGVFRGQRTMLIHGVVLEQHHGDPNSPDPRPVRYTREQYHRISELGLLDDRRVQLAFGEIIEMGNMGWPHARAMILLGGVIRVVFAQGHWVSEEKPFVAGDSLPVPDFAVHAGSVRNQADHPDRAVLLVEVSDTTLQFDTTTKAELYATAGVPEYWVLDVVGRRLLIFRDPEPLPAGLGATAYRTHTAHGPNDTVAPLVAPTAAITVADLLP